ncbi:unnamed protein product, partial [Musa textilis]
MTSLNILANYVKACTGLSRCFNIFCKPSKGRGHGGPGLDFDVFCTVPAGRFRGRTDSALRVRRRHRERSIPRANSVRGRARQGRQPRPLQRFHPPVSRHIPLVPASIMIPDTNTNRGRGVRHLRMGWADGPAYITQCPIRPG